MGHRANYLLKRGGEYELFYSHWGANVIENDLFWGPELAEQFVRSQKPVDEWLDEVWCEGGACLDHDGQELLFFGGEDVLYDPFLRQAYLALMEAAWSPWKVSWAHRGILDLARAVGVSDQVVLLNNQAERLKHVLARPELVDPRRVWCRSVLQIDEQLFSLHTKIDGALLNGPRLLKLLPKTPGPPLLENEPPSGGAVVHTTQERLSYWCMNSPPLLQEWLTEAWPGWLVERNQRMSLDQASHFLTLAGHSPPVWEEIVKQIEQRVSQPVKSRALSMESVREVHGTDAPIVLNPLATEDVRPASKRSVEEFQRLASTVNPLF